jgi:hypothetical protein
LITHKGPERRLSEITIALGGLVPVSAGLPSGPTIGALVMELLFTQLLCGWRGRVAGRE